MGKVVFVGLCHLRTFVGTYEQFISVLWNNFFYFTLPPPPTALLYFNTGGTEGLDTVNTIPYFPPGPPYSPAVMSR